MDMYHVTFISGHQLRRRDLFLKIEVVSQVLRPFSFGLVGWGVLSAILVCLDCSVCGVSEFGPFQTCTLASVHVWA